MNFQYLSSDDSDCETNGYLIIPTIAIHVNGKAEFPYMSIVFRFLNLGLGIRFYKI